MFLKLKEAKIAGLEKKKAKNRLEYFLEPGPN